MSQGISQRSSLELFTDAAQLRGVLFEEGSHSFAKSFTLVAASKETWLLTV